MPIRSGTLALLLAASLAAPSATRAQSPEAAALPASFLVVHGIPGRDVAAGLDPLLPVDVLVDGKYCLLKGLTFGTIAGPFDVPAGNYSVAVSLANPIAPCSNKAILSPTVTLKAGEFGSIVAALSNKGAPTAEVYGVDVSPVGAGTQRFVIAHAADAPKVKALAVSTGGGPTVKATTTLASGQESSFFVPTRSGFNVSANVSGGGVLGPVNVPLGDQGVALVFAVGSAKSGSATLLTKVLPSVH